jgi:hypothetical protein
VRIVRQIKNITYYVETVQNLRPALFWVITQRRMVIFFDSLTLEDGTDTSSRNGGNIPEERGSHQHHGGSLKSRSMQSFLVLKQTACGTHKIKATYLQFE